MIQIWTSMGIEEKRQRVFIVLVGIFLSAMTLLNVVGITKFIQLGPLSVAVGVLPYPLTFLCTDLISELYGKSRANFVVWVGLGLNLFIFAILAMGEFFPSVDVGSLPPWQQIPLGGTLMSPSGEVLKDSVELFHLIYSCSSSAILASMMAYITAQFCDVHIYHFLKKKTQGRHLWLRNNLSTMTSQAIDSMVVISVTFFSALEAGQMAWDAFLVILGSNYLFKLVAALLDTGPFYLAVGFFRSYLELPEETV